MPNKPENPLLSLYQHLAQNFENLTLVERLKHIAALAKTKQVGAVFTTSFGIEDQLITHVIFSEKLDIKVITLDTGRLFPQTYALWQKTEEHYGKKQKSIMAKG